MGKFRELIVNYSEDENSCDSLQLIDPVNKLSLESMEKNKSLQDYEDQSNKLEKLHLNDSNEIIEKRNKIKSQCRHHPYSHPKKFKSKIEKNKRDKCDMKFLKSLGYIQYSSSKKGKNIEISNNKIEKLFIQVNQSIKTTFSKYLKSNDHSKQHSYLCNRRFN